MNSQDGPLRQLMQKAQGGDTRAYSDLLSRSATILRRYLGKRLSNKNAVEDVVQEILISIHKARHTYDASRPYEPWLFAIASYRLKDYLRAHYTDRLYFAADLQEAENIASPDVTQTGLSYESIKEEIDTLPGKQAAILHLIHAEGYTAKEAGQKMGMKESAVKVAAHRAYKILKKKLVG